MDSEAAAEQPGTAEERRSFHLLFQHATVDQFTEAVERITGRKVRAFASGIDTEQDVSSEAFYLEPLP